MKSVESSKRRHLDDETTSDLALFLRSAADWQDSNGVVTGSIGGIQVLRHPETSIGEIIIINSLVRHDSLSPIINFYPKTGEINILGEPGNTAVDDEINRLASFLILHMVEQGKF